LKSTAFQALVALGKSKRATIKLSGFQKFSHQVPSYDDVKPLVYSLIDAYGLDACVWASDWPFLKAPERLDYGPLLRFFERLIPDADDRKKVLWDTPKRIFEFN
jgi:predicted TIM-barrel fold metal-dependent hydrolase